MSKMTTVILDNVNVVPEIVEFFNAIKLKNPKLVGNPIGWRKKVIYDDSGKATETFCAMEITYIDKPNDVVGRICYWDKKYFVQSRLIRNEKFAHWNRDEYNARSSIKMKNMIKVALDNLIPYTIQEAKEKSNGNTSIDSDLHDIRSNASFKVRKDLQDINNGAWYKELLHMHDTGYIPKDKGVHKAMLEAVKNRQSFEEDFGYNPDTLFVHVKEDGSVVTLDDKSKQEEYPSTCTLPKDIFDKVMVLMVTSNKTFVRDVGKKENNSNLWVLL